MSSDKGDKKKIRHTKEETPIDFKLKYLKYKAKYMDTKLRSQTGGYQDYSADLSNWINQQEDGPVKYYSKIVAKYGKPTYFVNQPEGVCKWIKGQTEKDIFPHEYIMLKDEYVLHTKPFEHRDFMSSVIKVHIPPESLVDIIKISDSINYDPLLKHLRARCASFAANYATFRTAFETIDKKANVSYATNITNKEPQEKNNEEYTKSKVIENQKKYSYELSLPYYELDKIQC